VIKIQRYASKELGFDLNPALAECITMSIVVWQAKVEAELVGLFGLIPPTLLSSQAYLWLHTTPAWDEHKFILVRFSQRMMEVMLAEYPTIVGHCHIENERAIRWLKWLGAVFHEPVGVKVPFSIRKK